MFRNLLILAVAGLGFAATAASIRPSGLEHMEKSERRSDGRYDVTCIDGRVEVRTAEELNTGRVCEAVKVVTGDFILESGGTDSTGMRLCDLAIGYALNETGIFSLHAEFKPPCANLSTDTQVCTGYVCTAPLAGTTFTFTFHDNTKLTLMRGSDGLTGEYAGPGTTSSDRTRLNSVNGVQNILEVSQDGTNWFGVCDDGFSDLSAAIVCRELGYSRVTNWLGGVSVPGSSNYGLDEVSCQGTEGSIWDCSHSAWSSHDCGDQEHVQIFCQ